MYDALVHTEFYIPRNPIFPFTLARGEGVTEVRWWDGITNSMNMSKLRERVKDREAWRAAVHGIKKSQT